jgi:uncharacterized protein (DUF433 family)
MPAMGQLDINRIRCTPAYSFVEAAHYLNLPVSTLSSWFRGQSYKYNDEIRRFKAVIRLDGEPGEGLSFLNLVEAHVLAAIRREHRIPLQKVRRALEYVERELGLQRPLTNARFETDGVDLLVRELEKLVNISQEGQLEIEPMVRMFLRRIKRDPAGVPIKLYPFTRKTVSDTEPEPVEIDPRVAFGRPVLAGRGVPTAVLADRFKAGDSLADLAKDYDTSTQVIEEAIRCELSRREAA